MHLTTGNDRVRVSRKYLTSLSNFPIHSTCFPSALLPFHLPAQFSLSEKETPIELGKPCASASAEHPEFSVVLDRAWQAIVHKLVEATTPSLEMLHDDEGSVEVFLLAELPNHRGVHLEG